MISACSTVKRPVFGCGNCSTPPAMRIQNCSTFLAKQSAWRAPTLILHGGQDTLIPVNQALLLRDRLKATGTPHRLVLYPDHGHFLPRASIREQTVSFLKETTASGMPFKQRFLIALQGKVLGQRRSV